VKPRIVVAVSVAACLLLTVSACSVPSAKPSSSAGSLRPIKSIYFSNVLPAYPPLGEANKCFLAEAKKLGIKAAAGGPPGLTSDNQLNINLISQAIANGYDAIVSQPIDKAAFSPVMQQAKDKGIYQATMNTGDTTDIQDFTIGTDYTNLGKSFAVNIGKRGSDQQNVGIIAGFPSGTDNLFVDGFTKAITSENLPNVKVVTTQYDQGDPSKTADLVAQMLTAHPEINVVLAREGSAAPGVITAIKEKNLVGKVVGLSDDVTPQVADAIKAGIIYGTAKQNFCKMGTLSVDYLVKLSKGQKVAKSVDTGTILVTKDNLATEGN
jgi:ABC-type sugar transport system substrate-binding protein